MEYIVLIQLRGNVYLLEDFGEIKEKIRILLNRNSHHGIGYFEEEIDKVKLEQIEAEVKQWLDCHLETIPIWTEERRGEWIKNRS